MADLKDEISPHLANRLARELSTAWPAFPTDQFTNDIRAALTALARDPQRVLLVCGMDEPPTRVT